MGISTKFTQADLLVMPEDGKRREIIEGELFVTPSPLTRHQRIVSCIASAIFRYLHEHPIGDLFVAPMDIIEILSPTTKGIDRGLKLKAYARFGIPEYWIVDPEKNAIEVYALEGRTYHLAKIVQEQETLTSPLLPGFALAVGEVFASY